MENIHFLHHIRRFRPLRRASAIALRRRHPIAGDCRCLSSRPNAPYASSPHTVPTRTALWKVLRRREQQCPHRHPLAFFVSSPHGLVVASPRRKQILNREGRIRGQVHEQLILRTRAALCVDRSISPRVRARSTGCNQRARGRGSICLSAPVRLRVAPSRSSRGEGRSLVAKGSSNARSSSWRHPLLASSVPHQDSSALAVLEQKLAWLACLLITASQSVTTGRRKVTV
ncbi:hypothetical protein ABZP36_035114 [Zizania latifolia]